MTDIHLIQLIGVVLSVAGMIALTASAHLFGTPLSPGERIRASDEWNRRRDLYRLPINLETLASLALLLGGIYLLTWTKFNLCAFLTYWLPNLPEEIRSLISCG